MSTSLAAMHLHLHLRRLACLGLVAAAAALAPPAGWAQSAAAAAPPAVFDLRGTTLEGKPFNLASLRGKVVMVFLWSTDCAVCRSKMPELRANAEGWRNKPFELVLVSLDRRRADLVEYDRVRAATQVNAVQFQNLWSGDAGYGDSMSQRPRQLPLTLLIDVQGRLAARFDGRIPAEAWDTVADLLP